MRAYIGVAGMTVPLHRRLVRFYHLSKETGVMVASVEPGSPADRADLKPNDIVVGYGTTPVGAIDDLHRLLSEEQIGQIVELTILRGTDRLRLRLAPVRFS